MNTPHPLVARCDTVHLPGELVSVCISDDGTTVVAASTRAIAFWAVRSSTADFVAINSEALSCSVSDDGLCAASTHIDGTLRLWDVHSRRCKITIIVGHASECIVSGGKVFVVLSRTSRSEIVCITWAEASESAPRRFCHAGEIRSLCASGTQGVMAAAYKPAECFAAGGHLMIQNFRGARRARFVYSALALPVRRASIHVATKAPIVAVADGRGLRVYNSASSQLDVVLDGNTNATRRDKRKALCAVTSCGERIVDTRDATVRMWSVSRRALVACVETETPIRDIAISGPLVVLGGAKGSVSVLDTSVFGARVGKVVSWPVSQLKGEEAFCPIDQENIKIGERVVQLPCGHIFHYRCMHKYLTEDKKPRCPLDRQYVHRWTLQYLPIWTWDGIL